MSEQALIGPSAHLYLVLVDIESTQMSQPCADQKFKPWLPGTKDLTVAKEGIWPAGWPNFWQAVHHQQQQRIQEGPGLVCKDHGPEMILPQVIESTITASRVVSLASLADCPNCHVDLANTYKDSNA